MAQNLTQGSIHKILIRFSIPFLIAGFLQSFYGLADLFIVGQFNGPEALTAVSMGSQMMHMLTVVIIGLATGTTVMIGRMMGANKQKSVAGIIAQSIIIFTAFACLLTIVLPLGMQGILTILATPASAWAQARAYLYVCFLGIPFITAYNVVSSIFRGLGDSKRPMYFVAIAGIINVIGDYVLVGIFHMGAYGAALATVSSQAFSVIIALMTFIRMPKSFHITKADFRLHRILMMDIMTIGLPISCQDGLIQVSFMIITAIANSRGVEIAAAVGIVEKIISFLFLVPSAMLASVSTIVAQNAGASCHERGEAVLFLACKICVGFGLAACLMCQVAAGFLLTRFTSEAAVITYGIQYLRSYSLDCVFAGIHFCFSGFFSAYHKSTYSFIHNILSISLIRIPGSYLAVVFFPHTLLPMGLAAPLGSLLSALICVYLYRRHETYWQ